jgi:hypothetical protein
MSKAIVTLVVGDRCYRPWNRFLRAGWEHWATCHGYSLVVFDQPLDDSARAKARSPAWQKLLAMAAPELAAFDQALWVDADVFIRAGAPDPLSDAQGSQILMARDVGSPLAHEPSWFRESWSRILRHSLLKAKPEYALLFSRLDRDFLSYYDLWGFDSSRIVLYNTGVIGYRPVLHRDLLKSIYHRWCDGGPGALYEMIPLNLELLRRRMIGEMPSAFNQLAGVQHAVLHDCPREMSHWYQRAVGPADVFGFLDLLAERNHFLHFAGAQELMHRYFACHV